MTEVFECSGEDLFLSQLLLIYALCVLSLHIGGLYRLKTKVLILNTNA